MSLLQSRRQLSKPIHDELDLKHATALALIQPNYILSQAERDIVNRKVHFETSRSQLEEDFESRLDKDSLHTGIDYAKHSLAGLGYENESSDPCSVYSVFGGPEGQTRHFYGQGLPLSTSRSLPIRAWSAPSASALGTGLAQPGQVNSVTPMSLPGSALTRFLQSQRSYLHEDNSDPVVTTQGPSYKDLVSEATHTTATNLDHGRALRRGRGRTQDYTNSRPLVKSRSSIRKQRGGPYPIGH